jgi:hypothetical protein
MTLFIVILISSFAGLVFMALCVYGSTYRKRRNLWRDRDPDKCGSDLRQNRSCAMVHCRTSSGLLYSLKECRSTGADNKKSEH